MSASTLCQRCELPGSQKPVYFAEFVAALLLMISKSGLALEPKAEARQTNRYPIELLHRVTGWGRNEMTGFKYWAG
jgi:hypothetical protein